MNMRKGQVEMWIYINSEPGLWTVGFYSPDGKWHADSDHGIRKEAADRVHYLNGGKQEKRNGWDIDEYIHTLSWSEHATQNEKTLVIGNIRSCSIWIATKLGLLTDN